MFHHSHYGSFGSKLKGWADLDGHVPEAGDTPDKMNYPAEDFADFDENGDGYEGFGMEQWEALLDIVLPLTLEADAELAAWRNPKLGGA